MFEIDYRVFEFRKIFKFAKILCLQKDFYVRIYFMFVRGLIFLNRGKQDIDYSLIICYLVKEVEKKIFVLLSRKFKGNIIFFFYLIDIFMFIFDSEYYWFIFKWIFDLFNRVFVYNI